MTSVHEVKKKTTTKNNMAMTLLLNIRWHVQLKKKIYGAEQSKRKLIREKKMCVKIKLKMRKKKNRRKKS